jgi:hypothetical protein
MAVSAPCLDTTREVAPAASRPNGWLAVVLPLPDVDPLDDLHVRFEYERDGARDDVLPHGVFLLKKKRAARSERPAVRQDLTG